MFDPLPYVKTLYYNNVNFYRYFIGRDDQSIKEETMIRRIDQHIYIAKTMTQTLKNADIKSPKCEKYMMKYLTIMYQIASILLIVGGTPEHLEKLQGVVSDKLDRTLNERLDTNFKMVGDQLGLLYKSLGELQALSSGVSDLNRTLANVKTRGVWGEVQLGRILEQTMTRSQYTVNVATKPNSDDRVEYAVLFPSQDGSGEQVYLPIDAKFPSDIYNKIVDAGENGDSRSMAAVTQELKVRILDEARTIRDKYLCPPRTTNYGIMFLPTEGLYAEVLRIDGLTEKCQSIGVIVAGPTTITAILNSLQAGFRNVALSRKSLEVMKLLEAVKTQFAKLDDEVERTQKKLSDATKSTDRLRHRTEIIQRRMRNITELDPKEAEKLLELSDDEADTSTFD